MSTVATLGYKKESSPAGERVQAPQYANYTQEFHIMAVVTDITIRGILNAK
jgi:hypothetical protein